MTLFQIILLALAAIFAYKIYEHVQTLEDEPEQEKSDNLPLEPPLEVSLEKVDEAFEQEHFEEAKALLLDLLRTNQQELEVIKRLGFCAMHLNEDSDAINYFTQALTLDENDDTLHLALASLMRNRGDLQEAKHHYEAALAIDEAYAITHYNFANLLVDMNDNAAAKEHYERAIALDDSLQAAKDALGELTNGTK